MVDGGHQVAAGVLGGRRLQWQSKWLRLGSVGCKSKGAGCHPDRAGRVATVNRSICAYVGRPVGNIPAFVAQEPTPPTPRELAGGNALQASYSHCSTSRLYAAALLAVAELGFAITSRDDATKTFSFRAGGPTVAWPSEEMRVAIHTRGESAHAVVGGRPTAGGRLQMANWHQAKAIGLAFINRLTSVLPGIPEPVSTEPQRPSPSGGIQSLTDLRDRGFLTEEEFAAAKRRLLR